MKTAFVTGGSGFVGRNLIPYLVERGVRVTALARSDAAAAAVRAAGAEPVTGDLVKPLPADALRGAEVVFHSGAWVEDWGDEKDAHAINVGGTERILHAARQAGVPRFVHVSTEAVLLGSKIVRVDETVPRPPRPIGLYARTKALAEERVEAANAPGFTAVIARPRFIWGAGDTTLLPRLVDAARAGKLGWIGGGRNLTSTCHVRNVCEGLVKAAARGAPGAIYFLTDGEPVEFRGFIEAMLRTQGVTPPTRSIPYGVAKAFSWLSDGVARAFRLGRPMLPYPSFLLMADEVTVDDARARRELGYVGEVSRDAGLREMEATSPAPSGARPTGIPAASPRAGS